MKNGSLFGKTKPGFESASLKYTYRITLDCLSAMVTEKNQKIHILAKISSARFWLALMAVFLRWWPVVRLPTTIASQFPPFTGPETVDFGKKFSSAHMLHGADRPDRISADERFSGLMACGSSSQSQNEPVSTVRSPRNGPFRLKEWIFKTNNPDCFQFLTTISAHFKSIFPKHYVLYFFSRARLAAQQC